MIESLRNPLVVSSIGMAVSLAPTTAEAYPVVHPEVVASVPHSSSLANVPEFGQFQTKPRPQDWGPDRIAAPYVFLSTVPVARIALRQSGFIGKIGIVQNQVGKRYPVASDPKYDILVEALTQRTRVPEKVNGLPTGQKVDKYITIKPGKNISNKRPIYLRLGEYTIIEDR